MARDLKLQVILDAVDRATGPLKKITQGSGATAEALKASRDQPQARVLSKPFHLKDLVLEVERVLEDRISASL